MENPKKKKFVGRAAVVLGLGFAAAILSVGIAGRLGDVRNITGKGGAMIASAWQNLFGSASYDVSSDNDGLSLGSDASDTAAFDSASSSNDFSDDFSATPTTNPKSATKNSAKSAQPAQNSAALTKSDTSPTSSTSIQDKNQNGSSTSILNPLGAATSSCGGVIINEVAWMGSPPASGESATAAANYEWIELKNISSVDINLAGWMLENNSGAIKIIFTADNVIPAGRFSLLARGAAGSIAQYANVHYSGSLANTGDKLMLTAQQCSDANVLDASLGWPGGDNTTKQTLERAADDLHWQTSITNGGTPGAENSAGFFAAQPTPSSTVASNSTSVVATTTVSTTSTSTLATSTTTVSTSSASAANTSTIVSSSSTNGATTTLAFCPAGHLVIAQVQIAGAASANDFVKIFNPTGAAIDLGGWKLRKKTSGGTDASLKALATGAIVSTGSYFTWANSANGFAASVSADVSSSETLAADNSIALINASGTIVDEVAWGTGTSQYAEGNAFPTNPPANQILERSFLDGAIGDSDDNANDFTLH